MVIGETKVLICDDSILSRKKMKDFLVAAGCKEVFEAADGETAVETYKANKPDVVFMDIVMPKKDGIGAVKDIIAFDEKAKIVMASSVGTQALLKDALKAGAMDFLQKPISNDSLLDVINKLA
ncbi:MAG: response regulator [Lachnospiraceae bacterium]|nr:response regulator [Lachnospiraceae bacterium]